MSGERVVRDLELSKAISMADIALRANEARSATIARQDDEKFTLTLE